MIQTVKTPIFALTAALCCSLSVADSPNWLFKLSRDPRSQWYDRTTLPEVVDSDCKIYPLGYNIAGRLDPTGTANNESPWNTTSGVEKCGPSVTIRRMLWTPEGKHIELWVDRRKIRGGIRDGLAYSRIAGTYPEGTVAAQWMFDGVRLFEARALKKIGYELWESSRYEFGRKPTGYVEPQECSKCHEDIGKHSMLLDPRRDWYSVVRGLERHGPIHWHPWDTSQLRDGRKIVPQIRQSVRSFVRWREGAR